MIFTIFDEKIVKKGSKPAVLYNSEPPETAGNSRKQLQEKTVEKSTARLSLSYLLFICRRSIYQSYVCLRPPGLIPRMQYDLDGLAGSCEFDTLVDVIQRKNVGDEFLRREDRGDRQLEGAL